MGPLGKVVFGVAAWEVFWFMVALRDRQLQHARARASADTSGKPLLVVGSPYGQYPCGDVTVDLNDTSECPTFRKASVESLPFPDKHFGAVFVSHVIEHTCNPFKAMAELSRVADNVYISYPRAWRLVSWLVRGHAWVMWEKSPGEYKFHRIRKRCNVDKYFGELRS